jgi:Protein of unknown function (DUF4011)
MSEAEAISALATPRVVVIKANISARLNVAFHQNAVPAVAEIELVNDTADDLNGVTISVSAAPGFLQPKTFRFDHIRAGGSQRLNPVPIDFDAKFLLGLTEAVRGEITIIAKAGEAEVARLTMPCQLLSPSEWTGLSTAPELLAAFVRPNDPSVDVVLRNAAEKLRKAGRDAALDGYRSNKKARAWELTEAIWAALCDERIVYALPAQSFERNGQKVRSPTAVLDRKIGTCLDLALLFAACLEQTGLNPLIGLSEGHAFCGVWLTNEEFSLGVVDERQTLRKRMQLDELILVETTLLTNQPPVRFGAAVEKGRGLVAESTDRRFELVIDVRRARHRQIKPLVLGTQDAAPSLAVATTVGTAATLEFPPVFAEEVVAEAVDETLDRLERWKRKLLDLSLRNKLLNFKSEKSAVTLVCPDAGHFEDKLAAGEPIKLLPRADVMSGADPRSADLHFRQVGDDAAKHYAVEALRRGDVHTTLSSDDLEDRLTEIFRSARNSFQEGGANSLYLAIGFVSWTPQAKEQTCKAPLLLVPVALERRTVRSGFRLVRHDDDARINPTLLQMLRQDFKLTIPEFTRDLPVDASGLDVAQIWRIARGHLKDVKGFELTEDVILSNFSFVKYLMWKDLVDRTEILKRNPVVKHLIDTPKESYGDPGGMLDEQRLDEEVDPSTLFMPLPADSSQTAAVVAAARSKDFVLFGPPGTGKSQTIANMVVQLLADRKTVLFVSQKTTALEVVRKRLNDIGLGSFCLEVHSAKAQKGAVLNQLKSAWESHTESAVAAWDGVTADLRSLRDQLNAVVKALHRRHRNGLTVQQAMGRSIRNREFLPGFVLSFGLPDQHDEADMRRLRGTCRNLKTALDAIGDPSRHPLATPFASAASSGEVRNGRPTIVATGAEPSSLMISHTISEGNDRLPASITPTVSTNATRARSRTMGGALLRSKPVTKSPMAWLGARAVSPPLPSPLALCCCARLMPGSPSRVAVLAPRKILRSSELPSSSLPIVASLMLMRSCDAYTVRKIRPPFRICSGGSHHYTWLLAGRPVRSLAVNAWATRQRRGSASQSFRFTNRPRPTVESCRAPLRKTNWPRDMACTITP